MALLKVDGAEHILRIGDMHPPVAQVLEDLRRGLRVQRALNYLRQGHIQLLKDLDAEVTLPADPEFADKKV